MKALNFLAQAAALSIVVLGGGGSLRGEQWREQLTPFFKRYCLACHAGEEAEGGLALSRLALDLGKSKNMQRWTLVFDRLKSAEMPPKGEAQPSQAEKKQILAILSATLTKADRARSDVVLRRLNRNEYQNSVRDLFDVHVSVKQILPQDNSSAGFDNVGEGLAMSAEAVRAYLGAANLTLDAVFGPAKKPKYIKHHTNLVDQKTHDGKPFLAGKIGSMFRKTDNGLVIFQSGYCPTNLVNFARLRAPAGTYRGTMRVRAVQSKRPVTLRIYAGDTIVGRREKHLVGYFDVPPGEWTTIKFTDRLVQTGGTFQPKCYGTKDTRKNADTYPEPGIEVGDITIEGPLEQWPPVSRRKLLGSVDPGKASLADAKAILKRVLPRAFRRPVRDEEMAPYVGLVDAALTQGRSFQEALRVGLQGVLCSPEFLFLEEPGDALVNQHALAARLSYFLWSSLPDEQLSALARDKKLRDPEVLRRQTERLLNDPKSKALTTNFVGQWLDLRDIDFTSPDANLYPEFDELLKTSMVEETHRFFAEILRRNLSLMTFIDSDFSIINERLAKHYGIPGIQGQSFRQVELPKGHVRGGVLTQASVLKVTANGTNTSPVMRGLWVRENILGRKTPLPPDGVAAVEPDIRGATTLRQQLAKHRNVKSCAVCHNKIDPAGFALENFDVIGGWRDRYRTLGKGKRPAFSRHPITFAWIRYRIGLPVDSSGTTERGQYFNGIRQFKDILLKQDRTVALALTNKLTTYALGRRLGFSDRQPVEEIVTRVARRGYGFRTLVHEIVQSELFQKP